MPSPATSIASCLHPVRVDRLMKAGDSWSSASAWSIALAAAVSAMVWQPCLHAGSELTIRVIAVTGEPAPGTEDGTVFTFFTTPLNHSIMHPVIDSASNVGIVARVDGPNMDPVAGNGLWIHRDGELQLVARSGDEAPGLEIGQFSGFPSDYIPFPPSIAGGRLAFAAEIFGPGLVFGNNVGLWKEHGGALALIAVHGGDTPGIRGGTFGTSTGLVGYNAPGHALVRGNVYGAAIPETANEAIWFDSSGSLTLLAREGDPAPGLPDLVFGVGQLGSSQFAFPQSLLNDQDQILLQANLAGPDVTAFNDEALWMIDQEGALTLILREGDPAPGAGNGVTFGGNSVSLMIFAPTFNNLGQSAFTIRLGGSLPTTTALYSTHSGELAAVALPGEQAPGEDYDFGILSNPMLNDAGSLAFRTSLPDDDGDPFIPPPFAIWSDQGGVLQEVVSPGIAVPDREGATIGSPYLIGFNSAGQLAFTTVIDDSSESFVEGLFLADPDGAIHPIVATGDMFDVFGDGEELRTVLRIVPALTGGGALSEGGEVAFRLDFTDGSSGHYTAKVGGPILCAADFSGDGAVGPADLAVLLAAWGPCPARGECVADIDPPADQGGGDGGVGAADLAALLASWGDCQ